MNSLERDQLNQFLQQLVAARLNQKDEEADHLIKDALARQPDAGYLLIQRCLLQDQALHAAQAQISDLQRQLQQKTATPSSQSFLNDNPWAPAASNVNGVPGASHYQMPSPQPIGNSAYARPHPQNSAAGFGSSFLGNIATTAAGVVAGSFLFQGLENLLGHHAQPTSSSMLGQPPNADHMAEQTIINNYYGDSDPSAVHDHPEAHLASYSDDNFVEESDLDSDWI